MHKSVLVKEVLEYLGCEDKDIILDCTVGGAGHAKEILRRLPPGGRLIGIDADEDALKIAEEALREYRGRFSLAKENFRNFDRVLSGLGIDGVDGMLFDLGVSSFQLEDADRGFSFSKKGILDMRMDTSCGRPLWEAINTLRREELAEIIRDYGEERYSRRIADAIISERDKAPIRDTLKLAGLIRRSARYRAGGRIDPATRTFQALRIFINDEINALREALDKVGRFLRKDGRIVVVSFHSLEDRVVKNSFKEQAKAQTLAILTKKPIRPTETERRENPRSRSAKLRAAQRIG